MTDAREYLRSFRLAESRIQLKTRQVKDLQDRLLCISAPMDKEMVSHTPNVGVMADTIAMIIDLQNEIDQQAAEIVNQKRELFRMLDQIDPEYATLLTEHYLDGMSFVEIGRIHGMRGVGQKGELRRPLRNSRRFSASSHLKQWQEDSRERGQKQYALKVVQHRPPFGHLRPPLG